MKTAKTAMRILAWILAIAMMLGLVGCSNGGKTDTASGETESAGSSTMAVSSGSDSAGASDDYTIVKIMTHRTWTDTLPLISRAGEIPYWYWGNTLMNEMYVYGGELKGELAEEYTLDESAKTLTFKIREGVKFSNGADLTAEDVAFTYQLHVDNPTSFNSSIVNYIESIDVTDTYNLTFHLKDVGPLLWDCFCQKVPIMDKETYEADPEAYIAHPIGTSGWTLKEYDVTTKSYSFTRWDESWWWDFHGYSSNVDELQFIYNSEESSRVSALRSGEVDIAESIGVDSVSILEGEGFAVDAFPAVNHNMLGFNTHEGAILADVNLREAICRAIDRQAIVDSLLGGNNYVYTWPVEHGKMGFVESDVYSYDPEKAASLVAASGYNGETLEMIICNSYVINAEECAQAVQAYLQAVGLNVNVSVLESGTYEELKNAGEYDINFTDLSSGVSEGIKFAYEIYCNDQFNTGYIDHDTDLYDIGVQLYTTNDENVQKTLRTELFTRMAENYAPYILLWSDTAITAHTAGITDIVYPPVITAHWFYAINVAK